jgi:hypothetical protein
MHFLDVLPSFDPVEVAASRLANHVVSSRDTLLAQLEKGCTLQDLLRVDPVRHPVLTEPVLETDLRVRC